MFSYLKLERKQGKAWTVEMAIDKELYFYKTYMNK